MSDYDEWIFGKYSACFRVFFDNFLLSAFLFMTKNI